MSENDYDEYMEAIKKLHSEVVTSLDEYEENLNEQKEAFDSLFERLGQIIENQKVDHLLVLKIFQHLTGEIPDTTDLKRDITVM